jgi:hypothetical protein
MALDDALGQDQFKPVTTAPTDCRVLTNHRAGYGSTDDKTERVLAWLTRNPDATLSSGEGGLLLRRIRELEAQLESLRPKQAVLPELETSFYHEDRRVTP